MNNLKYKSTRSGDISISSIEAIIKGIAEDGGLYVPSFFNDLSDFDKMKNLDYKSLAFHIIKSFFSDFTDGELLKYINNAYDSKFDTPEIAPLIKNNQVYFLELFHGPTLAFKDMALTLLPHLLKGASEKINCSKEIVILVATSGDTGKAALEGFKDVEGTKIIVFYPTLGVSEVQRRQMTTQEGSNTYVLGINGSFDDAQSALKEIFNDREFNSNIEKSGYIFSSANSINIGRLIPQIIYYFYSYLHLLNTGEVSKNEKVNIVVPTGNFGNILAAYYSMKMGLPINKLICASNENNVLFDFFKNGIYDKRRKLKPTISPSMDILVSSNLERLLYDLSDCDHKLISNMMESLNTEGYYEIPEILKQNLKSFYGGFADESKTYDVIKKVYNDSGYVMDTHTAVAYSVYNDYINETSDTTKTIITSTASPFKFTKSVCTALNINVNEKNDFQLINKLAETINKQVPVPLENIEEKPILHHGICNKEDIKNIIENILEI